MRHYSVYIEGKTTIEATATNCRWSHISDQFVMVGYDRRRARRMAKKAKRMYPRLRVRLLNVSAARPASGHGGRG